MQSYKTILPQIDTFLFDVDGVLTDGTVFLLAGEVVRSLNSKDSYAIQYAAKLGYKIFIITGGDSAEVQSRLTNLGATEVVLKAKNKMNIFKSLKSRYALTEETCLYVGDDIPDLELMKNIALPCCPKDAAIEIKNVSKYVSPYFGGKGCARDIIEQTLKAQGKWMLPEAMEW